MAGLLDREDDEEVRGRRRERAAAQPGVAGYLNRAGQAVGDAYDYFLSMPDRIRQQTYDYAVSRGVDPAMAASAADRVASRAGRTTGAVEFLMPQTAGDVALMAAGPLGRMAPAAGRAALALGGGLLGMEPGEAEAGRGDAVARGARNVVQRAVDAVTGGGGRTARAPVTPEGYAIKGPEYTRAQQSVLRELASEAPGVGPIDLSRAAGVGSTPQAPLERVVPPRGVSPRMQRALENPDVTEGVRGSIQSGVDMGADRWYHTDPILQAFVAELGPEVGPQRFRRYMDYVAATSPRSDVSTNIRNASFYYTRDGQPLAKEDLIYPYGHVAQNLHLQNAATIQNGGFNVLQNPKPASFSENLQGNLTPVTVDTHAFRNIGMRTRDPEFLETSISIPNKTGKAAANLADEDRELLTMAQRYGEVSPDGKKITFRPQQLFRDGRLTMDEAVGIPSFWASKPRDNEYGAAEQLYARLGQGFSLPPADTQAAAWAGAGQLTGLASPPTRTFPQLFNERVEYTARMRGEDPQDTLRMMIRGERPLLGLAGGGLGVGGLLGGQEDRY
jgi:hypothetical protein